MKAYIVGTKVGWAILCINCHKAIRNVFNEHPEKPDILIETDKECVDCNNKVVLGKGEETMTNVFDLYFVFNPKYRLPRGIYCAFPLLYSDEAWCEFLDIERNYCSLFGQDVLENKVTNKYIRCGKCKKAEEAAEGEVGE